MKNSIVKSILSVAFLLLVSNTISAQKSNEKAVIKTFFNCDHCEACETCGQKFKTEMLKIKGLRMYELDEKAMTFTVYFNSKKTNIQTIREAISKLGYDADDVKADPKAYENLDQCCKA